MNTENFGKSVDLRPVTKIIASYVGNHALAPEQLSALIVAVQQALRDLGKQAQMLRGGSAAQAQYFSNFS